MYRKRLAAAVTAAICLISCAACGKGAELSVDENVSVVTAPTATNAAGEAVLSVGDIVEPDEDSEEYVLGSYRVASDGVKFYYDEPITEELMFAIDTYFTCFQNNDYDTYETLLYPDYKERYSAYLQEEYEYDLRHSFELNGQNLRTIMQRECAEGDEDEDTSKYTGDFTITRIKAEEPELEEGETIEGLQKKLFEFFDEAFEMDYYEYVKENSDDIEYVCFYIYARGEDGAEHRLISGYDIAFALVDGRYYAFG
ncbi:MAG: hypothetical protein IKP78_03880 [Ruminococcus sp.]|nr:hypothetical protein [Ruminococcus sp.]